MSVERPLRADSVVEGLWRAAAANRLPHALLFHGPDGVGKFLAARWFAAGLFCVNGPGAPCGVCGPCKRIEKGAHPDLHVVDPRAEGEEVLKVERIATRPDAKSAGPAVEELLSLRPGEGGWRVVLIRDFDLAADAAQNALLKTLEEPRPNTLLVLVTGRPERLLATVHSRCMGVAFERLDAEEFARVLEAHEISPADAERLSRWSEGSPGRALALGGEGAAAIRAALAEFLAGELDATAAARAIEEAEGRFPGQTPAAKERARVASAIELAAALLRDLVRRGAGIPTGELAHGDWIEAAGRGLDAWGADALEEALEGLWQALLDLGANITAGGVLVRALLAVDRARGRRVVLQAP